MIGLPRLQLAAFYIKLIDTSFKNQIMQSRRDWLKAAMTLSAGIPIGLSMSNQLLASPVSEVERIHRLNGTAPPLKILLNANENPYGPSEKAKAAVQQSLSSGNRYTMQIVEDLKAVIAKKEGVTPEHVSIGPGSGALLCEAGIAFGLDGKNILSAFPTFPLLMTYAESINAKWDKVDVNDKLEIDYQAMAAHIHADTRLVFICNPNNPTGTLVDPNIVREFCMDVSQRVPVYVDEAYLEFLEPAQQISMVELVKKDYNVIVSKTFSKIYGLAGLRIGYIIGKPDLVAKMQKFQMGIPNNQAAIAAAKASLGDDAFMEMCRKKNAEARNHLTSYLDKKGIFYGKSYTNFVFFAAKSDAGQVLAKLENRGIGIRVWDYKGKQWYRVSIGTLDEMKIFTRAFDEAVS
jgi:histidinol-phosphate aminotransferase